MKHERLALAIDVEHRAWWLEGTQRAVRNFGQRPLRQPGDFALRPAEANAPRLEDMSLEDVERFLIRKALARYDGNAKKAADALGLSRSAFYRRLEKHGL